MATEYDIQAFLSGYSPDVIQLAMQLRHMLRKELADITEQIDLPAKIIAYTYGPKYLDLICVIIPSKKGLKLGFNRGVELYDPDKILEGDAKISRYVQIKSEEQINSIALKQLLSDALLLYKKKTAEKK